MKKNKLVKNPIIVHLISLAIMFFVNILFFYPQFEGKVIRQGDMMAGTYKVAEINSYPKEVGKIKLWTNGYFSGMPRLMNAPARNNLIFPAYRAVINLIGEPVALFLVLMALYYMMLVYLGVHPAISLIISIGVGLSTSNLQLYEAGHLSKIRTLIFTPLILTGVLLLFERGKYWIGGILFTLGMAISIYTRHPQMTYYIFLALGVYGIIKVIRAIQYGRLKSLVVPILIVTVGAILAIGASASKMISIYEYSKSTMRGKPILKKEIIVKQNSSSHVEGLDWEYAMSWSNGTLDLLSGFIPGLAGGGSAERMSKSSETFKNYRMERAALYWGKLPFTEGPFYFGAVIMFLFVFGLFFVKGDLKLWIGMAFFIMAVLSMGKNIEIINKFVFNTFPFYNKFRAPQSIMSAALFIFPILGGLSLKALFESYAGLKRKKKSKKIVIPRNFKTSLIWAFSLCGSVTLFFGLLGPSIFSFEAATDIRYIQQGADVGPLIADRMSLMRTDAFRSFLLVAFTASLFWYFMQKKISKTVLILGLGVLIVFDMWSVGKRYLAHDEFIKRVDYTSIFKPRPVDQQIIDQEKGREFYRVFDMSINTFNDASTSAHHNTIGGYDPAKLQRYQDLIDYHISKGNQAVLNMLNTKYIIRNDDKNKPFFQKNANALGNAWFVDDILKVNSPNEEINAMTNFNPSNTAVVFDQDFDNYIGSFEPVKDHTGTIELTQYNPVHLTYQSNAISEQLAVFSEIWYGPNKGWNTYVDGEPVDHIRVNYVLRALRIPAGSHKVEFVFHPKSYFIGEKIALICSLLIIGSIIGYFVFIGRGFLSRQKE